jgi:hypothetical protein
MLKMTYTNGAGVKTLLIGLSAENIRRMGEGKPIHTALKDMGWQDCELIVITGDTEDSIMENLERAGLPISSAKINDERKKG